MGCPPLIGTSVRLGHDQRMHPAVAESLGRVQGLRILGEVLPGGRLAHVDPEAEVHGRMSHRARVLEQERTPGVAEFR